VFGWWAFTLTPAESEIKALSASLHPLDIWCIFHIFHAAHREFLGMMSYDASLSFSMWLFLYAH
jgi:hypothetical protein